MVHGTDDVRNEKIILTSYYKDVFICVYIEMLSYSKVFDFCGSVGYGSSSPFCNGRGIDGRNLREK